MERPILIGIVGGSGSGKSWLASRLAAHFDSKATIIGLDDFYRDLASEPADLRETFNFDEPEALDWECLRSCMERLVVGGSIEIPDYDFSSHTRSRLPSVLKIEPMVILEGLWLLHHSWLRSQIDFSIYIDCSPALRLTRRIDRDLNERGRSSLSTKTQFNSQVAPNHSRFVEPQRPHASTRVESPIPEDAFSALCARLRLLNTPPSAFNQARSS